MERVAPSVKYELVEALGQQAEGLPCHCHPEQLGPESHFARLRLLDPDRYSDFAAYQAESAYYAEIAPIAGALHAGNPEPSQQEALAAYAGAEADLPPSKLLDALLDRHNRLCDLPQHPRGHERLSRSTGASGAVGTRPRRSRMDDPRRGGVCWRLWHQRAD